MHVQHLQAPDWQVYKAVRLEALCLHASVYGSSYQNMLSRPDTEWEDMLDQDDQAFFGLFDGDDIVGIGAVFMQDAASKTGMLISGYIRESHRGKGFSRLLYQARIDWAKASGLYDRLIVGHREGNEVSRRANQAFGFQPTGEIECIFGNGENAKDLQYELRLR